MFVIGPKFDLTIFEKKLSANMFRIGWDVLLQPKGNIIAPMVFIPAKKTPKMGGTFAMKSMLKAIYAGRYL